MLRCYTKNPPNLTEPRSPNVKITARYEGGIIGETIFLLHPNVEFEAALRQIFPPALRRTNSAKITAAIDLVV